MEFTIHWPHTILAAPKKNAHASLNLGAIRVGQDTCYTTDTGFGVNLLVPLQQMAAGALGRYFEAAINVLHQDVQQVMFAQQIHRLIHLR